MSSYDMAVLQAELARDEGERLKPYRDSVGKLSIGIGRNLDDVGISHDEAVALLSNDIVSAELWLDRNLPWWGMLDDVRQRVLLNMVFNMRNKLLAFKKFLDAARGGRWQDAHDEMLDSLWARQVGVRAQRLAYMMLTGESA